MGDDLENREFLDGIVNLIRSPPIVTGECRDWFDRIMVSSSDEVAANYVAEQLGGVVGNKRSSDVYFVDLDSLRDLLG